MYDLILDALNEHFKEGVMTEGTIWNKKVFAASQNTDSA